MARGFKGKVDILRGPASIRADENIPGIAGRPRDGVKNEKCNGDLSPFGCTCEG